jgi:hypothetical protein
MNPDTPREDELLGYLLNALEGEDKQRIEAYLAADPDGERVLAALSRALDPLAADRDPPEPHQDLVFNTLKKVTAFRCRPPAAVKPPALANRPSFLSRWRRSEVLVAASIAFLVLLFIPPALVQARFQRDLAACRDNLGQFHKAFVAYADDHNNELPAPCRRGGPLNRAGAYAPVLRQAALWNENMRVVCPANAARGAKIAPPPSAKEIEDMRGTPKYDGACRSMGGCYAYSLGYVNETGQLCGLRKDILPGQTPLMSDRPRRQGEADWETANSPNHGGRGQNVLYLGGQCRYERTRSIDGDDIFLNRRGKLAPGVDSRDSVLAPSETPVQMPE